MAEQDIKNITVLIAGRPFPLKIKEADEPVIRKIVKDVNEKINRFQLTYANKDKQDCLAMVALTYAVDLNKTKQSVTASLNNELSDKLSNLDALLDEFLSE